MSININGSEKAPLSYTLIHSLSKLVDDAQVQTREPSHSDIEFWMNKAGLSGCDPKKNGRTVGKMKRVREVLTWAFENDYNSGEIFAYQLISLVRGCGGFCETSSNFVGSAEIEALQLAFKEEGFLLDSDGILQPVILESLSGLPLTDALKAYVRRAKCGVMDAALVTGTGKDLLEATAAHILTEKWGYYPERANFPTLLGQAFSALGFATPASTSATSNSPQVRLQKSLYETACSINMLRNKQGTGHGRPWVPTVTDIEARLAVETMGCIAEWMLMSL